MLSQLLYGSGASGAGASAGASASASASAGAVAGSGGDGWAMGGAGSGGDELGGANESSTGGALAVLLGVPMQFDLERATGNGPLSMADRRRVCSAGSRTGVLPVAAAPPLGAELLATVLAGGARGKGILIAKLAAILAILAAELHAEHVEPDVWCCC